jgi:tetratricopeptide (TPR) repeat protein
MKKLLSFSAILILVTGIAYANTSDPKPDLEQEKITKKPVEADAWFNKGNTAYDTKNYDEAIKCYKEAIALDPGFASAHYNLGVIYGKKGMLDESIVAYKTALDINPDYYMARNDLGSAYMQKGMLDEAISELQKVLTSKPDLPHVHFNLGQCYFKKGDKTLAANHYFKAGMLFADRGDKDWTQKSYEHLKKTNSAELEKSLLERINSEKEQEKGFLEQFIDINPKSTE